jgi:DNA invertase Pin-like site-specific DNA recombinase
MLSHPEKITDRHRERRASVYVRQSSPYQVQHHQESQRNQYALVEQAVALGWARDRVRVIDADLGLSGQDGSRQGFRELVAEVSLGQVGIILAYEASRLARSNADWYALLDLAAMVGTLIADPDGVYDPRSYNDRLLLGLRGMLSEAELHLLQLRMEAGRMRQIERGVYRQHLPTGLVRLPDGQVSKDPDLQVQRTIELIFARFAQLGSCQKVLRSLRDDGIVLPRRQTGGPEAGELRWKPPAEVVIYEILHNPAYAGAFVYGRHGPHPDRRPGTGRRRNLPLEEWTVIHQGVYPAYIKWETFMANQARLRDNASQYTLRTRGAVREGNALLVGLVVCGRCGRQMHVEYKTQHRYVCSAMGKEYAAPLCLHLDGPSIDAVVVEAFFQALQPAELALLDETLAALHADHERLAQHYADQVKRAAYDAKLAERQYQAVDPDNRLVTGELERRWEMALRALQEAREAQERFVAMPPTPPLDPVLRAQLDDLGRQLPALWTSGRLTPAQQKELLRSLIRRVVLTRPQRDTVEANVVWVSGAMTPLVIHPPVWRLADLADHDRLVARARALSAEGYHDKEVAQRLTAEGFRSPRSEQVLPSLVTRIRRAHGQITVTARFRRQEKIEGQWTIWGLVRALQVDRNWLYARIQAGRLPATRHPIIGHYLIPHNPGLLEQLKAERPPRRQM